MRDRIFSPEEAVDLAMRGFIVSDKSGAVLARAGGQYLMRRAGKRGDFSDAGVTREVILKAWTEFLLDEAGKAARP